jgi:hypothetical protein
MDIEEQGFVDIAWLKHCLNRLNVVPKPGVIGIMQL